MRALVGAGKTGVSRVPGSGNRISISGTMPSLTSSSAIRSGVSARLRRIGASHFLRKTPSLASPTWLIGPLACGPVPSKSRTSRSPSGSSAAVRVSVIRWVCSIGSSTPSCSA